MSRLPRVLSHFDELSIRDVDAPQEACKVTSLALHARSGPSTTFDTVIFLSSGDQAVLLDESPDGKWIQVRVSATGQLGWVIYHPNWVSCNIALSDLPVSQP